MLIFGSCVGDGDRFAKVARPTIERHLEAGDLVLTDDGSRGICAAYNAFIQRARGEPRCRALILLHDDVEILDRNFRAKISRALSQDNVGIVGVIGGSGLKTPAWWSGRVQRGRVFETRGALSPGDLGPVDVVDGLMLVLSRAAFENLEFDAELLPGFHGYDTDICLKARSIGLDVKVAPIILLHRTRGGFGDEVSWKNSQQALARRWNSVLRPESVAERIGRIFERIRAIPASLRRRSRVFRERMATSGLGADRRSRRETAETASPSSSSSGTESGPSSGPVCPVCRCDLAVPEVQRESLVECATCGTGVTWPRFKVPVTDDEVFPKVNRSVRKIQRLSRLEQATKRLQWVELYRPDGVLLDVGCATGEFVEVANDEGYLAYGVEPSRRAVDVARKSSTTVLEGDVGTWRDRFPGVMVDVVSMWQVLDHVADPRAILIEIGDLLLSDGYLFGEVPNFSCPLARREREDQGYAERLARRHHFTPDGLRTLLETSGFTVEVLLPLSTRIYLSDLEWRAHENALALKGVDPNNDDFIRFVARKKVRS